MNRRKTIHRSEKDVTYIVTLSHPLPVARGPRGAWVGVHRCQGLKNVTYGPRTVGLVTLLDSTRWNHDTRDTQILWGRDRSMDPLSESLVTRPNFVTV